MLLRNARLHTMDPRASVVDALVVRDGRVVFAGRGADVNAAAGEERLDLGGRAVVPGLIDAHSHLMSLAKTRLELGVAHRASEDDAASVVAAAAAEASPGDWLLGRGWDQTLWPGQTFPSRGSLDRAAPMNPVALTRVDGHATWASSLALRAAGI